MMDNPAQNPIELSYVTALPGQISKARHAAWITLLVVGILNILGGLCLGGIITLGIYMLSKSPSRAYSVSATTSTWLYAAGYFLVPPAAGIAGVICSIKIKKLSRPAARIAAILVGLQIVAVLVLMVIRLTVLSRYARTPMMTTSIVVAIVLSLAALLLLAVAEFFLIKVLREPRPQPG